MNKTNSVGEWKNPPHNETWEYERIYATHYILRRHPSHFINECVDIVGRLPGKYAWNNVFISACPQAVPKTYPNDTTFLSLHHNDFDLIIGMGHGVADTVRL